MHDYNAGYERRRYGSVRAAILSTGMDHWRMDLGRPLIRLKSARLAFLFRFPGRVNQLNVGYYENANV